MSSDLEKFLQQAAERLAQKAAGRQGGQSQRGPGRAARPQSPPVVAEVIAADVIPSRGSALRELGPNPLSDIDTRPELAREIGQADERMLEHVHKVFDHELTQLRAPSSTLAATTDRPMVNRDAPLDSLPVLAMLQNPNSLKTAFIASEIFKRKT